MANPYGANFGGGGMPGGGGGGYVNPFAGNAGPGMDPSALASLYYSSQWLPRQYYGSQVDQNGNMIAGGNPATINWAAYWQDPTNNPQAASALAAANQERDSFANWLVQNGYQDPRTVGQTLGIQDPLAGGVNGVQGGHTNQGAAQNLLAQYLYNQILNSNKGSTSGTDPVAQYFHGGPQGGPRGGVNINQVLQQYSRNFNPNDNLFGSSYNPVSRAYYAPGYQRHPLNSAMGY